MSKHVKISYDSDSSKDEKSDTSDSEDGSIWSEDETAIKEEKEPVIDSSMGDEDAASTSENSPSSENEDDAGDKSHGLAVVMSSILKKKTPEKVSVILAKGSTDRQLEYKKRKKKEETEKEEKGDTTVVNDPPDREKMLKKRHWEEMGRLKPDVLGREKERKMQRIATRGVVQLFNAVRTQQKLLGDKLKETGSTETKKEKVVQSFTKGSFLDMLKGNEKKSVKSKTVKPEIKEEVDDDHPEQKPGWNILRDDFMMGADMKDWDKQESDSGVNSDADDNNDISDSDSDR